MRVARGELEDLLDHKVLVCSKLGGHVDIGVSVYPPEIAWY